MNRNAVGLLALLLLPACNAAPSDGVPVTVEVRRGPIAPVAQEGTDNTAAVGDAEVRILHDNIRIDVERTDGAGLAGFVLEPGSYEVRVTICPGTMALPAPESVVVQPAEPDTVTLVCDTGIR